MRSREIILMDEYVYVVFKGAAEGNVSKVSQYNVPDIRLNESCEGLFEGTSFGACQREYVLVVVVYDQQGSVPVIVLIIVES